MNASTKSSEYLPLVDSHEEDVGFTGYETSGARRQSKWLMTVCALQSLAIVALSLTLLRGVGNACVSFEERPSIPGLPLVEKHLLWSPAQDVIEHEVKTFTVGGTAGLPTTKYQGLSDDVDRAWGDLYNHTILKIPMSQAALLPNRTYPIADDKGYYIAGLDVFHQIHCLNIVRRALDPQYYVNDKFVNDEHVYHCVDSIRQSLMCSADVAVNVWQWDEGIKHVVGRSTVAHSCRNYDKIRDWARENRIHQFIDPDLYVEDPLDTILSSR